MKIEELEARIADIADDPEAFERICREAGLDPEPCGIFCGRLAKTALEELGYTDADAEWNHLGPRFTTLALCAFEAALYLAEGRRGQ